MISPSKAAVDAWARRELKADAEASTLEVRQAALRLVGSTQFGPMFDDSVAIGVALGRPRDSVEIFQREAIYSRDEESLRHEIEAFAGGLFDIPRPERGRRWRELLQKTEVFPWWRTRLAGLEKWIDVDRPSEFVNPLAEVIFKTVALAPVERVAQRREVVNGLNREELAAAIAEVKRSHPEIAEIGGLAELLPKPPVSTSLNVRAGGGYAPPVAAQSPQPRRWPAFAIIFLIATALRILTSDSTTPRRVAPAWEQGGQVRPQVGNRPDGGFEEIRRKLQFDRDEPKRNFPDVAVPDVPRRFENLPDFEFK